MGSPRNGTDATAALHMKLGTAKTIFFRVFDSAAIFIMCELVGVHILICT